MVTRILDSRKSVKSVHMYSETKVLEGKASIVHFRNLDDDDLFTVGSTFERLESNPAISARARKLAFHMAVNPGVDDAITEDGVIKYIDETMEELGYGKQPYIVYRHNDIERVHYHVVSVRVREDGRIIPSSHEGLAVSKIQERLGPVYGFHAGLPGPALSNTVSPGVMRAGCRNVMEGMKANIEDVMENWSWTYPIQLQMLLAERNILMKRKKRGDNIYTFFGVMASGGNLATRLYGASKVAGPGFKARLDKRASSTRDSRTENAKAAAAAVLEECLNRCPDFGSVAEALKESGYVLHISGKKSDEPQDMLTAMLSDQRNRCIFNIEDLIPGSLHRLKGKAAGKTGKRKKQKPTDEKTVAEIRAAAEASTERLRRL